MFIKDTRIPLEAQLEESPNSKRQEGQQLRLKESDEMYIVSKARWIPHCEVKYVNTGVESYTHIDDDSEEHEVPPGTILVKCKDVDGKTVTQLVHKDKLSSAVRTSKKNLFHFLC